ncbi:hypothetical protein T440DRAFT_176923 [Plenodomus tracheiphilus IPT5]|uniref:Uncharacterized protein n=1 Tax=Plenodomus tracheiphilus IPT5 TaxID=1408161 RepID=A0A6A7AYF8_9PLEO|nr:hypothetical protein T440DRAFT_176923 [Plenodomus tracheiphilus IPT5]
MNTRQTSVASRPHLPDSRSPLANHTTTALSNPRSSARIPHFPQRQTACFSRLCPEVFGPSAVHHLEMTIWILRTSELVSWDCWVHGDMLTIRSPSILRFTRHSFQYGNT